MEYETYVWCPGWNADFTSWLTGREDVEALCYCDDGLHDTAIDTSKGSVVIDNQQLTIIADSI
jgi:hypothetical protein